MSSDINARESENAMCDILISARYVLAIDAFANKSILAFFKAYCGEDIHIIDNRYQSRVDEMVKILYDLNSEAKAIRIGYDLLRQGKRVAFVSTGAVMVRALVEKASKLSKSDNSPVRACAYYGDIDGKQRQKDFSNINNIWGKLDCVAYTNIVEVGISFEITGHFYIVIAITNIAIPSSCTNALPNSESEKSVVEDLRKSYSAKHLEVIQELFQILGFTGINNERILSDSMVSEAFTQSYKRFIEVLDQFLLLFGFKSHAKVMSDLNSAIRAINTIAGNWYGYTVKINRKKIGPKEK
ncbi:5732_t:CDS:2 [Funneliformis geosporum]|nr:5732_t:CDS:2 [Funneliformis geosporum]